jgi:hypothetical protein
MRELLVRGKNTIDPEVIDPGGRSVEDSPVKSGFTFTFTISFVMSCAYLNRTNSAYNLILILCAFYESSKIILETFYKLRDFYPCN